MKYLHLITFFFVQNIEFNIKFSVQVFDIFFRAGVGNWRLAGLFFHIISKFYQYFFIYKFFDSGQCLATTGTIESIFYRTTKNIVVFIELP